MEKTSPAASQEPESFIVQNATLSYHFISDIGLSFSPKEVKDLTWEDPNIIKKSRNLKDALRTGYLKRLSPEQYEKTLDLQYRKEQKQLEKDQQRKATYSKQKNKNGNEMIAERVDLEKTSRKNANELDITGTANHPMSVVQAYAIAEARAQERGDDLSVEEFLQFVEHHPNAVASLLSDTRVATASSQSTGNAYYAQPRGDVNSETGVVKASMKNINRSLLGADADQDYEQVEQKMSDILDVEDFDEIDNMYLDVNEIDANDDEDDEDFAEEIIIDVESN